MSGLRSAPPPPTNVCWRCAVQLNTRAAQSAIRCKVCGRLFHRKCYLTETGVSKEGLSPCICCLSGISSTPYPSRIQQNSMAVKFLRDGFCVISLANSASERKAIIETLVKYKANADRYFTAFMRAYEAELEYSTKIPSLESGFSNFRQRGKGRFELISPQIEKEVLSVIGKCDLLWTCLDVLLTPAGRVTRAPKKSISTGCFYSLPGSSTQSLHTDGPPLSNVVDLYPYAINVFIPLVPVDKNNGTEFFAGSHRGEWHSRSPLKQKSVTPTIPLGKALLFDYRVLHRGLGNRLGSSRPCYYTTFAQSWYEDKFNFSSVRYRTALNVPSYLLERRGDENARKRQRIE